MNVETDVIRIAELIDDNLTSDGLIQLELSSVAEEWSGVTKRIIAGDVADLETNLFLEVRTGIYIKALLYVAMKLCPRLEKG